MSAPSYKVGDVVTIASEYFLVFSGLLGVNCDKNSTFVVEDIKTSPNCKSRRMVMIECICNHNIKDITPHSKWFDSDYFRKFTGDGEVLEVF